MTYFFMRFDAGRQERAVAAVDYSLKLFSPPVRTRPTTRPAAAATPRLMRPTVFHVLRCWTSA